MVKPLSLERLGIYYTIPSKEKINGSHTYVGLGKAMYFYVREDNFNQITPYIYLGKLPSAGYVLPSEVKLVVSMSTYEELADSITPVEWKQRGLEHIFLHIPDYTADVSAHDALAVVQQIKMFMDANPMSGVYFHCKQGHSRSAMICSAFLTLYGEDNKFASFDKAFESVKSKRPFASLNEKQSRMGQEIVRLHDKSTVINDEMIQAEQSAYLGLLEAKNAIRQMIYFKELAIYATRLRSSGKCESAVVCLQQFFNEVLFAKDGKWYENLCANQGILRSLLDLTGLSQDEREEWTRLIQGLKAELKEHLAEHTLVPEDDYADVFARLYAR